jgi:hypothetical protein
MNDPMAATPMAKMAIEQEGGRKIEFQQNR